MNAVAAPRSPRRSPFLRELRRAILIDLELEILLVERLAVLRASGYRQHEAAKLLGANGPAIKRAADRLKLATERLDRGDD